MWPESVAADTTTVRVGDAGFDLLTGGNGAGLTGDFAPAKDGLIGFGQGSEFLCEGLGVVGFRLTVRGGSTKLERGLGFDAGRGDDL